MSKKQTKRKKTPKTREQQKPKHEEPDKNRRALILMIGGGAAATAIVGTPAIFISLHERSLEEAALRESIGRERALPHTEKLLDYPTGSRWEFLNNRPKVGPSFVKSHGIFYGPPNLISGPFADQVLERDLDQILILAEQKGIALGKDYAIKMQSRDTLLPLAAPASGYMNEYVTEALDFMFSKIKGIRHEKPVVDSVQKGKDYSKARNSVAICKYYFETIELEFIHRLDGRKAKIGYISNQGFHGRMRVDDEDSWRVILRAGKHAWFTIYSEMLGITMSDLHRSDQIVEMGIPEYQKVSEAATEGIALKLGTQFARKNALPDLDVRVRAAMDNYSRIPSYSYAPASLRMIDKHGIQYTFDLYTKGPLARYREELLKFSR